MSVKPFFSLDQKSDDRPMNNPEGPNTVRAVYELREAAVEHGRALAADSMVPSEATRDSVLETKLDLESKTIAAIDECSESASEAAAEATRHDQT